MNVDYQSWAAFLGLPANDSQVVAALAADGVTNPITLRSDELTVNVDFKRYGMSVGFTSEYALRGGVADLPILTSVVMKPVLGKTAKNWTAYSGSLPYGLKKTHSKNDVVSLLGDPVHSDSDFYSARWKIDGRELG